MHLKSIKLNNFRKYQTENNKALFQKSTIIDKEHTDVDESNITDKRTEEVNNSVEKGISDSITLIVGKNNSGKTTITHAISLLLEPLGKVNPYNFNLSYLQEKYQSLNIAVNDFLHKNSKDFSYENLNDYLDSFSSDIVNNLPKFGFELSFLCDSDDESSGVLNSFIPLDSSNNEVKLFVQYGIAIDKFALDLLKHLVRTKVPELEREAFLFNDFIDLLQQSKLTQNFQSDLTGDIDSKDLNLNSLFNVKKIEANRNLHDKSLSKLYGQIIKLFYESDPAFKDKILNGVESSNKDIKGMISDKEGNFSAVLSEIESSHFGLALGGGITESSFLTSLIKYTFSDYDNEIPENQFGLGYVSLLYIIGEIIHFIEDYDEFSEYSGTNLLFIEEPEAFMHPHLQEFFINRINNAVNKILDITSNSAKPKRLKLQTIITTHSAHILNSKIHTNNTLDNIIYLSSQKNNGHIINLSDKDLKGNTKNAADNLTFLKTHIKFKASELFFCDAVILVEGVTEEVLLQYYLSEDENLKNYYITIFRIDGAHASVYKTLLTKLNIPTLIITDLDIKRSSCEKGECKKDCKLCDVNEAYKQVEDLTDRISTNHTLCSLYPNKVLSQYDYIEDNNIKIVFQKKIGSYYATSFEEALILSCYENLLIQTALDSTHPNIYKDVTSNGVSNLPKKSYYLQAAISRNNSKSKFANNLLLEIIKAPNDRPELPKYILDGLGFLVEKLG